MVNCLRGIKTKLGFYPASRHTWPRREDMVEEFIVLPSLLKGTNMQIYKMKTWLRLDGCNKTE